MTSAEFERALNVLGLSAEALAADLAVTPSAVEGWSAGTVRIPKKYAQEIAWRAALAERENALKTSGLSECSWQLAQSKAAPPTNPAEFQRFAKAISEHIAACDVCIARARFEEEHFGPMPEYPQATWLRVVGLLNRVPSLLRPALIGALFLGGIVSIRIVLAFPTLLRQPDHLLQAIAAVLAAAGAGAFGGLAYSLTRPTLRKLGSAGAYLSGVVCVVAYLGALVVIAPIAFGESLIEDRQDATAFAVVAVLFGLFIGHMWFRGSSAIDADHSAGAI